MRLTLMKSKIHRATVTEANLNYVGSVTIDEEILESVGLLPNEKVQVVNINNGERIETYAIKGEKGSGVICLNGAAARLFQPGDLVIIIGYADMEEEEAKVHKPKVAIMGENNVIEEMITDENHGEKKGTLAL
ncbi:aspartate 1-decarboxylase [Priestia filamentosa]|uniref:aspartate 1-decarboxylase n=1 Tax=Priestia filamentosa TaxID=1402861 RepID=UPI000588ED0F|nr:aspartate 1-decarboxylase [Priestia filamentosa]MDT3766088.1 aspartate 1-decarboxylase [Priestia filamentosa]OXS65149.1 aspartate 1-decarboxylase [Priestia filamentosa]RJS62712.1 aspartate 1-decarboxylase [Priestia filamentosa]WRU97947.1 aspartate 1-decarboxylase [Priestia filamentosa]SMF70733.1 L-aspartate 1-decarboxylase [Priestia filamentosa]